MPRPIQVTFDPEDQSFEFDPEELHVPQGIHKIDFKLKTKGGGREKACFDPRRGVHFKQAQTVFTTDLCEDFKWVEIDNNQDQVKKRYAYQVTVQYEGKRITSPDPFIINDPPIGRF